MYELPPPPSEMMETLNTLTNSKGHPAFKNVLFNALNENRAAIDYLLLLHHHTCEEFEGLCCFNLSSKAENVRQSIQQLKDMVHTIKQESKDFWDSLFENWGLTGWLNSLVKSIVIILFILLVISITCGVIKRFTARMIANATSALSVNQVWATAPRAEEIEMDEFPTPEEALDTMDPENYLPEERWPPTYAEQMTNQRWFAECYPDSDYLPPPPTFSYGERHYHI
ncbi:hypothetical protein HGM15179_009650 [Zosterops borbonicus]|uniref:Uncharacterized protein n=1 Tax=Zosterops borbonicus TaxID=364589 RepID=A0A8K1GEV2_9PASS|nr:hypothetical protein HGM15179_009650 [Zosterops borbonicus]